MATFKIYTARLDHSKVNRYLGEIEANDLSEAKQLIKKPINEGGFLLNPYYAVILDDTGKELHNEFCSFYEGHKTV